MTQYKVGYYVVDQDGGISYFDSFEEAEKYIREGKGNLLPGTQVRYSVFSKSLITGGYCRYLELSETVSEGEAQDFIDDINERGGIYLAA